MLLTLTIKQVGEALNGVCDRTATLKCKAYGVKIYPREKGPGRWVYAAEFYMALHGDLFPDLIKKYGDKAFEAYQAYKNNDPLKLAMLEQERTSRQKEHKKYLPEGKIASNFLEKIKNKSSIKFKS